MKAPVPSASATSAPARPASRPGEIAVDIDRKNRVLGNPFVLHNPSDAAARNDVIERFRAKYEADLKCDGPMSAATEALAERVRKGERLVCMCWCWPKRCHGAIIIDEIKRRLEPDNAAVPKGRPLLAILSRPALSSPNVAAEMDQAAALQARGKSPERTLVGP